MDHNLTIQETGEQTDQKLPPYSITLIYDVYTASNVIEQQQTSPFTWHINSDTSTVTTELIMCSTTYDLKYLSNSKFGNQTSFNTEFLMQLLQKKRDFTYYSEKEVLHHL